MPHDENAKRKILFFGDSNTYGYDPADLYEGRLPYEERWTSILAAKIRETWDVIPEGLNGRKLPVFPRHERRIGLYLDKLDTDDVFAVMLGTNDILLTEDPDAAEPVRKMDRLLAFLSEKKDPGTIFVLAPPLIGSELSEDWLYRRFREENRKMNDGFRELAEKWGVHFADTSEWKIPLCSDLVHLSKEGHMVFAEHLIRCISDTFPME